MIRYTLKIEAEYEDSGDYMGADSTLAEFQKYAADQARTMTVLLQRGSAPPKPVKATIRLDRIAVIP